MREYNNKGLSEPPYKWYLLVWLNEKTHKIISPLYSYRWKNGKLKRIINDK